MPYLRKRFPALWFAAALLLLLLGAAACTSVGAAAGAVGGEAATIRFVTGEWKFEPAMVEVPAGRPVTFVLENKGVTDHDLTIDAAGIHLHARPGETVKAVFTVEKAGTYDFVCSIPGHKEAGMRGMLSAGPAETARVMDAAAPASVPAPSNIEPARTAERLPQPAVAPPLPVRPPAIVPVEIEAREAVAAMDDGVSYTYWTFNGTVPGPMIRVRQGDTVDLTFKNPAGSTVAHSIDLHAVTGPGGGATYTQVPPGEQAEFRFKALNPGVYVYHCATPMVAHHIASGMYGMIVVEPEEGLPPVDREYYVMEGDFYLEGARGQQGHRGFDMDKMLDERPDYVVFNGSAGALTGPNALRANVGETVRIFFGVGGPNTTSSFHVIGEIFDRVFPEGASEPLTNVQTTMVPAGGATMVEFKAEVPGAYTIVDHSLARLQKGAAAVLEVEGPDNPGVFQPVHAGTGGSGGH